MSELSIEGNAAFSDRKLFGLLETRPPKWWFWKADYLPDVFEKDLSRLTDFYHRRGYLLSPRLHRQRSSNGCNGPDSLGFGSALSICSASR